MEPTRPFTEPMSRLMKVLHIANRIKQFYSMCEIRAYASLSHHFILFVGKRDKAL